MLDGADRPRRRGADAGGDAEPPRADRRRDRYRQDQDAPAARRAALGARGAGVRRRHEGRPLRAGPAARPTTTSGSRAGSRSSGSSGRPRRAPVSFLSLGGLGAGIPVRATVSAFGPQLLAKVLDANETQSVFALARLPLRRRQGPRAARPRRPACGAHVPHLRRGQGRPQGHRRAVVGDRRACCCARSSSWRTRAATRSSASPSWRWPTCSAPRPTGRASCRASSWPRCRTSRSCSRRSSCGCWPSCSRSCPRSATYRKPKLVFFFDEAHLLFDDATEQFRDQVAQTVRLIRSKGVGVFFVTQLPDDVPDEVLAQLGNRVRHALRAFTPRDAKALKAAVSTYPTTEDYELERGAHRARHRRGDGHDPLRAGRAHAGRVDQAPAPAVAHGSASATRRSPRRRERTASGPPMPRRSTASRRGRSSAGAHGRVRAERRRPPSTCEVEAPARDAQPSRRPKPPGRERQTTTTRSSTTSSHVRAAR